METLSDAKFKQNYARHLQHLKLKGLQPKTIDAYSRAIRRIGNRFNHEIDNLSEQQLTDFFTELLASHSWSAVKLDLYGLKFYYDHVLRKPWVAPGLIKPPKTQRLPDIVTIEEAKRIFAATGVLSYRVFFFTLYSLGLRLGEGLRLQVGDIDAERGRVHIRDAKGNRDRFVPLPQATHKALQRFRQVHRNPVLLFPNRHGGLKGAASAATHMDRGGVQTTLHQVVKTCGLKKDHATLAAAQLRNAPDRDWRRFNRGAEIPRPSLHSHHRPLYASDRPDQASRPGPDQRPDGRLWPHLGEGQMIRLATIIDTFEAGCLAQYRGQLRSEHYRALAAMKQCRTQASPMMRVKCTGCEQQKLVPHSCGHRHCPHCQHHESQQWLERQMKKQVPAEYFLLTFTLPAEFRALSWAHQSLLYELLMRCSWETVRTFSRNDKQLHGTPGAIAVLHTNTRQLEFHPHVHLVMPAAALDAKRRQWRTKRRGKAKAGYLFNYQALAKVFRAKMLAAIEAAGLTPPRRYPEKWVVDCKSVGSGESALIYLGRYLYRGVIAQKDIVACDNAQVSFALSQRQDREDGTQDRVRCAFSVARLPACAAQRLPAGAQLWLSASQLQAPDRLVACAAQVRPWSGRRLVQTTRADPVHLLPGGDDDHENAASVGVLRGRPGANCYSGDTLIV